MKQSTTNAVTTSEGLQPKASSQKQPIVIAGAGPAGLFMGLCLVHQGFQVQIFEQRSEVISDTRSLGIHPPSLCLLEKLGLLNEFLKKGIQVHTGLAHDGRQGLGRIEFSEIDLKPSYLLIHPQNQTEAILKQAFMERMPNGLHYGVSIESFLDRGSDIEVLIRSHDDQLQSYHTPILIACDGKNSSLREYAQISFDGHAYPDTYIMGDFPAHSTQAKEPTVYITQEGLIESFPLPDGKRRWVAKTDHYLKNPQPRQLSELIKKRIDVELDVSNCTMMSSFGVQHMRANKRQHNRFFVVGDAAHVVSPIGGQGMNLGWLGAWQLSLDLTETNIEASGMLAPTTYERQFHRTIREVAKRAEWNMKMGRKSSLYRLKIQGIRLLLGLPWTARFLAGRFSMSGLGLPKIP